MGTNKRLLKAFARFDGTGRIIAGSLVLRQKMPKNGNWQEVNAYECCNPTTSTTTTTTTTVALFAFRMLFDDIANANAMVGGDSSVVADWNTFFNLPTNGTPFDSVTVTGNEVVLFGGSNIVLSAYLFGDNDSTGTSLLEVTDTGCVIECADGVFSDFNSGGCFALSKIHLPNCVTLGNEVFSSTIVSDLILPFASYTTLGNDLFSYTPIDDTIINQFVNVTSVGTNCFDACLGLINIVLPSVITLGIQAFANCDNLQSINFANAETIGDECFSSDALLTTILLPSVTSLGTTVGDNQVFFQVNHGNEIDLTIPAALMTVNGGNPDGDIQYLQANNTVTITTV